MNLYFTSGRPRTLTIGTAPATSINDIIVIMMANSKAIYFTATACHSVKRHNFHVVSSCDIFGQIGEN